MNAAAISLALARFVVWEAAMFAASIQIAWGLGWRDSDRPAEKWLAVLAIEVTLEASLAGLLSFSGANSVIAYWAVAAVCLLGLAPLPHGRGSVTVRSRERKRAVALIAAFLVPLIFLSFKPVEEIDSINYLHYLIEWMANRATPYTFATNYVAFWELSFLPSWMVTGVDLFFPLLALKAVLLLALAAWLAGRELGLGGGLLLWTVFGSVLMRHFWFEYSGIPTLKNDALHGAGFVLLALVVLRAARGSVASTNALCTDMILLAFGAAFASVKYTGIFAAAIAIALVMLLRRPAIRSWLGVAVFFLLTSGHYYVHNLLRYGSPFYPFQINLGLIHLPGTADLSNTSILYSLRDPRLWRALFLPAGGVSPAGLLFPAILAGVLLASAWRCLGAAYAWVRHRTDPSALDWTALLLLCGWLLYFRSVFSASAYAGDLSFIRNNLNSIRYVDGVLALSEIFLVALLAKSLARFTRLVWVLVVVNVASRLVDLYSKVPSAIFPPLLLSAVAVLAFGLFLLLKRRAGIGALACLMVAGPFIVERNRLQLTTYWNDLKPSLEVVRDKDLAVLAVLDGGYFAAHVVAAGNPVHTAVRTLLPQDLEALAPAARPRYLAVMVTSGSEAAADWQLRYGSRLASWGYRPQAEGKYGALLERKF
ncbi:membrane hypothetical protein [Candidatus Sulfopaludibacter sp. SbA6]|nr:membrane hypothetical protein [Candidatus Sulfopaludibacter sp. SbA6]